MTQDPGPRTQDPGLRTQDPGLRTQDQVLRELMALACRIMVREGLVGGWGHLSARLPGGDSVLITPRVSLALVQPADLVTVDLEGSKLGGARNQPLETHIHTAIFRRRVPALSLGKLRLCRELIVKHPVAR